MQDLLGRTERNFDLDDAIHRLDGARVLVTGAGGFIGSRLIRRLATLPVASLVAFDHSESGLFELDIDPPDGHRPELVVGSITDTVRITDVHRRYRPDVVFHAAAHKHVPLMEQNPKEAVKNNLGGTLVLLDAARRFGVRSFVLVSSDKAAAPAGIMGLTKRLAERAITAAAAYWGLSAFSVRLANVFGSDGSVVPTFMRQIAAGVPLTITDPRSTRYFISPDEAVASILVADRYLPAGGTLIFKPGAPRSILEVAEAMAARAGTSVEALGVRVIGLRPGEKLTEVLHEPGEPYVPTTHPALWLRPGRSDPGLTHLQWIVQTAETVSDDEVSGLLREALVVSPQMQSEAAG